MGGAVACAILEGVLQPADLEYFKSTGKASREVGQRTGARCCWIHWHPTGHGQMPLKIQTLLFSNVTVQLYSDMVVIWLSGETYRT